MVSCRIKAHSKFNNSRLTASSCMVGFQNPFQKMPFPWLNSQARCHFPQGRIANVTLNKSHFPKQIGRQFAMPLIVHALGYLSIWLRRQSAMDQIKDTILLCWLRSMKTPRDAYIITTLPIQMSCMASSQNGTANPQLRNSLVLPFQP